MHSTGGAAGSDTTNAIILLHNSPHVVVSPKNYKYFSDLPFFCLFILPQHLKDIDGAMNNYNDKLQASQLYEATTREVDFIYGLLQRARDDLREALNRMLPVVKRISDQHRGAEGPIQAIISQAEHPLQVLQFQLSGVEACLALIEKGRARSRGPGPRL